MSESPLRNTVFRALWGGQLVSSVGTWMQTVGAQWTLVHQPNASVLVSLVQAAALLPMLFVSLPAGVLADVLDRRLLLIQTQAVMVVGVGVLAALSFAGLATPALVIVIMFLLGCGNALVGPAWQAVVPEVVDVDQIPAASALNSLSINIARAVGPALAGVIITLAGPWLAFALNGVSYLAVIGALLWWRRPKAAGEHEPMGAALRSGTRYVRNAPGVRRILLRAALFVLPASALWALLPVVASARLGLGSGGYGALLAALGAGAVGGALVLGRLRRRFGPNTFLAVFTVVFALGTLATAVLDSPWAVGVLLVPTGTAWLIVLSTLNTTMQLTVAPWVRARGMAVYLIVFLGGQGVGSLLWGAVSAVLDIPATLAVSAALLVAGAGTLAFWPLSRLAGTLDRSIVAETEVAPEIPADHAAPVLVCVDYRIAEPDVPGFLAAATAVGTSRRRTGALTWAIYRSAEHPDHFVEVFTLPTWHEHVRQRTERTTGYDRELADRLRALSTRPPIVHHFLTPKDLPRRRP